MTSKSVRSRSDGAGLRYVRTSTGIITARTTSRPIRKCVSIPACRYRTTSTSAKKNDAHTPVPTESARRKPMSLAARSSPLCSSRPNAVPSLAPPGVLTADTVSSTEDAGRTIVGLAQRVTVSLLNGPLQSPVNRVRLSSYPQLVHRPTRPQRLCCCLARVRHTTETNRSRISRGSARRNARLAGPPPVIATRSPRKRRSTSARRPAARYAIRPPAEERGHDFGDLEGLSHPTDVLHVEPFRQPDGASADENEQGIRGATLQRSESSLDVIGDGREIDESGVVVVAGPLCKLCDVARDDDMRPPCAKGRLQERGHIGIVFEDQHPRAGEHRRAGRREGRGRRLGSWPSHTKRRTAARGGRKLEVAPRSARHRASVLEAYTGTALTTARSRENDFRVRQRNTGALVAHRRRGHSAFDRTFDDDATPPRTPTEGVQEHVREDLGSIRGER